MDEKGWSPKVGDKVIYQRIKAKQGLIQPPLRGIVVALYTRDQAGVRFNGGPIRPVKRAALKLIE